MKAAVSSDAAAATTTDPAGGRIAPSPAPQSTAMHSTSPSTAGADVRRDSVPPSPSTLSKLRCYKSREYLHKTLPRGVKCLARVSSEGGRTVEETWSRVKCDIADVQVKFDGADATLFEGKDALQVTLPEFRVQAAVSMQFAADEACHWEIGWVTACYNYDTYVRLALADDVPPFTPAGKVFCNAPARFVNCGNEACSPWHSARSFCAVKPSTEQQTVTVTLRGDKEMHVPDVQWNKMVGQRAMKAFNFKISDQYYSWLVVRNVTKGAFYAIYTIVWERRMSISIDVQQPLGNRTRRDYRLVTGSDDTEIWPLPEMILEPVYLASSLRWSWYPEDPLAEPLFRPATMGDLVRAAFVYVLCSIFSALLMYFAHRRIRGNE